MSGPVEIEKTVEILIDDLGAITLVLKPALPVEIDGFKITSDPDRLRLVLADGRALSFPISTEQRFAFDRTDQILVSEFGHVGEDPVKETEVLRDFSS